MMGPELCAIDLKAATTSPVRRRVSVPFLFTASSGEDGTLPGRHHILRFEQIEQMALGRKDFSVARTDSGADILRLAGLLGDDNLIRHQGLVSRIGRASCRE